MIPARTAGTDDDLPIRQYRLAPPDFHSCWGRFFLFHSITYEAKGTQEK